MGKIIRKNFVVSVIMARVYVAEERHIFYIDGRRVAGGVNLALLRLTLRKYIY